MITKVLGAILILTGCGGFGMMICIAHRREEDMLRQLVHALDYMQCELESRMTPMPELCIGASGACKGIISRFFLVLSGELSRQASADVRTCIKTASATIGQLPEQVEKALEILALSFGQFDIQGQVLGLDAVRKHCDTALAAMGEDRETRLRSYQTLGICAGAAFVILLV